MSNTPLTVLDLVPIPSGSTAGQALRNSIDLARNAEQLGYARYWFAEHHLNPGVAGTSPAVLSALAASATSTIRIGSGALLLGHRTALSAVEEFGLIDALYPGRLDLGLGRTRGAPRAPADTSPASAGARRPSPSPGGHPEEQSPATSTGEARTVNGLRIPPRFAADSLLRSPRFAVARRLLSPSGAPAPEYAEQVGDLLELLRGTYRRDGVTVHVVPGENASIQVWVLGSSGGESAQVAGRNGLRFAANYHVSPATVLEAVEGYRAEFQPSSELDKPFVSVSADVVVGRDEATARELATGYGLWVRSIRGGEGAIEFPTPDQARRHTWSEAQRALVADRVDTQFVGSPSQVADQLERLRDATEADELIVTTMTHKHSDRVRSYALLSEEWHSR